jgi:putative transposase
MAGIYSNWREFLLSPVIENKAEELRRCERTGRPLGDNGFLERLENELNRVLRKQKPGRKKVENK